MSVKVRVFLLEDDINLADIVSEYLEEMGYEVSVANDANEAEELLYEKRFDVLLLDGKVPVMNGFDLLEKIRSDGVETPAIFLTSMNTIEDVSRGYEAGCDDYIKKPFELKELLLRVQSLTKRVFNNQKEKIKLADELFYDIKSNKILSASQTISIPKKEARILRHLIKYRGQIVTSAMFFQDAWDFDEEPSEESLRTHIKNLRKLIGKDLIQTARGQGYTLVTS